MKKGLLYIVFTVDCSYTDSSGGNVLRSSPLGSCATTTHLPSVAGGSLSGRFKSLPNFNDNVNIFFFTSSSPQEADASIDSRTSHSGKVAELLHNRGGSTEDPRHVLDREAAVGRQGPRPAGDIRPHAISQQRQDENAGAAYNEGDGPGGRRP